MSNFTKTFQSSKLNGCNCKTMSTINMSDITFYAAIKPFLFLNKIIGLVPFAFSEQGYALSKLNTGFNVAVAILYGLISIYGVYQHIIYFQGSALVATSDNLQVCTASVFIIITWIYIAFCQKKHTTLLMRIVSIDRQLVKFGDVFSYNSLRKKIYLASIVTILTTLSNIIFQVIVYENLLESKYFTFNITYNFPIFMNSAVCMHVGFFILLTKERFKIVNVHLKELRKINTNTISISGNEKNDPNKTVLNSLQHLCYLHHQLTKIIKLTNEIFGPILLFSFITSFVAIVVGLFFCSKAFQTMEKEWTEYVVPVISCSTNIIMTIFICTICQSTVDEVNKAGILIHKIDTEDYDTKDQIEMFSLQIATEQAEYNAAGFFPVDYTLLFSIIAGVTTYLIILIQLSG